MIRAETASFFQASLLFSSLCYHQVRSTAVIVAIVLCELLFLPPFHSTMLRYDEHS